MNKFLSLLVSAVLVTATKANASESSKTALRSHHNKHHHQAKVMVGTHATWGDTKTLELIHKDLVMLQTFLPTIAITGSPKTAWTMEDFVVQSGTPSIVYGCPLHFKEDPANQKRIDFAASDPKMNDIDLWIKDLRVDAAKVNDLNNPLVIANPIGTNPGGLHIKLLPLAIGNTYEIEAYSFDTNVYGKPNDDNEAVAVDDKLAVWSGPNYAISTDPSKVAKVQLSTTDYFYSLAAAPALGFKQKLVWQTEAKRAKGATWDYKYKHYQDMMDVLCFCEIILKGSAPFNGNNPLVPQAACTAAGTDTAKKAAYNSCIIGGGMPPAGAPPAIESLSCPLTAKAVDAENCVEASGAKKSLFDTFKCA